MNSLSALGDSTRQRIVELLGGGKMSAGEIAQRFAVSAPAISQHLKTLREARLVRVSVDAQRRIYELDPDGLTEIAAWLSNVRRFWAGRLDLLEVELAAPQRRARKRKGKKS